MLAAGVEWLQLRAKRLGAAELFAGVERLLGSSRDAADRIWVNDRPDVAALVPVLGVHLGQSDLPPQAARHVVGDGCRIGLSTHSLEQVEQAERDPAVDLVAVGPVFSTASKENADPVVGLELVRRARLATGKPIVAIGGIDGERAGEVLDAGADSVALIGALARGDVGENCRRLLELLEG